MTQPVSMPVLPFVALGIPTNRSEIFTGTTRSLWGIGRSYRGKQALIFSDSSMLCKSCSMIVDTAMELKAEYIFYIDSDMTFPADTLHRLLAHDKDIVAIPYLKRSPPYETLVVPLDGPGDYEGLIEAESMAMGLSLIRTKVFESLPKPYWRFQVDEARGLSYGPDIVLCRMLRERGFKIWADTDLAKEVGHIGTIVVHPGEEGKARLAVNA